MQNDDRFVARNSVLSVASVSDEYMLSIPFFAGKSLNFLRTMSSNFHVETFNEGDDIITQGQLGDKFYLLYRGSAVVLRDNTEVDRLEDGSIFGQVSLLGQPKPRNATIRALKFCDCRVITRKVFQAMLTRFPKERKDFVDSVKDHQQNHVEYSPEELRLPSKQDSSPQIRPPSLSPGPHTVRRKQCGPSAASSRSGSLPSTRVDPTLENLYASEGLFFPRSRRTGYSNVAVWKSDSTFSGSDTQLVSDNESEGASSSWSLGPVRTHHVQRLPVAPFVELSNDRVGPRPLEERMERPKNPLGANTCLVPIVATSRSRPFYESESNDMRTGLIQAPKVAMDEIRARTKGRLRTSICPRTPSGGRPKISFPRKISS